jgi:ABC-2 type transport system ATP-binding protein
MINVENLVKNYGPIKAVKDISFSLNPGEILGFLGPNGAGKTTVMRILSGYHFPDSGKVEINSIAIEANSQEHKKYIGYLPENVPLYGDMTPKEFLEFTAKILDIPKAERKGAIEKALALCGLEKRANQRIETLSRGLRQRTGLAQAVFHDPVVLVLDEPSTGLDPNQSMEMRSLIRELGKTKTIILSTHNLKEVESVCSRFLILHEGCIVSQGDVNSEVNMEDIFVRMTAGKNGEPS